MENIAQLIEKDQTVILKDSLESGLFMRLFFFFIVIIFVLKLRGRSDEIAEFERSTEVAK